MQRRQYYKTNRAEWKYIIITSVCPYIQDLTFLVAFAKLREATVIARAERDGTRAETRFRLSPKRTVHLNRWGRQFSRLLATEVRASAWVMLDRPRSELAWEYWLPTPFASFPFISPPVRHHMPPGSERALLINILPSCITLVLYMYRKSRAVTLLPPLGLRDLF